MDRFIAILVYAELIIENAAIVGMYMVERLMMPFDDSTVVFPKIMFSMKRNNKGKAKVKNNKILIAIDRCIVLDND